MTIYKNSTAVSNFTAAISGCLLASLNFLITFYREMINITFEAYAVRSNVLKFNNPVTIFKNSTDVTN